MKGEIYEKGFRDAMYYCRKKLKTDVINMIRAELIQSIQNGTIKIEKGHEELFRIIDKYKTER